jgi:hypothetical protein
MLSYYVHFAHLSLFQDYERMMAELPNIYNEYIVPHPNWNHLDFMWGIDADTLLFPQILKNVGEVEAAYQSQKIKN